MFYQLDDVATTETMRGKIARQCHICLKLKLHPVLISSIRFLRGVAEAALDCARRTSTF
jgi:hypothetical protein